MLGSRKSGEKKLARRVELTSGDAAARSTLLWLLLRVSSCCSLIANMEAAHS